MKILYTLKEYAKKEGLSEIAIRKRVSSNYNEIIKIGKETYIIEDDIVVKKLKQNIKNKNSQIRELKLKLEVKSAGANDKYIQELEKQIDKLELRLEKQEDKFEAKLEKKNKKINKLQDQKDTMYEKFLSTLVNNKNLLGK